MERLEIIKKLNEILLDEMPEYRESASEFENNVSEQRRLLRSLMNLRRPKILSEEFISLQDGLLSEEREEKGIIDIFEISFIEKGIKLWRGDITRVKADAIVNAANSQLLGCFSPCHGCIDNAIHSAAGLQLREECNAIMQKQGHSEKTGGAKITRAYNLPSKFVIHTVGPIIRGEISDKDYKLLSDCYRSCLEIATENSIKSIVFCCISTGEFHFPNDTAAEIAVKTVRKFLSEHKNIEVMFNVFKKYDEEIYKRLLGESLKK